MSDREALLKRAVLALSGLLALEQTDESKARTSSAYAYAWRTEAKKIIEEWESREHRE